MSRRHAEDDIYITMVTGAAGPYDASHSWTRFGSWISHRNSRASYRTVINRMFYVVAALSAEDIDARAFFIPCLSRSFHANSRLPSYIQ